MASSSSSSRPSGLWKHDVFLSFRGEDTRKTFVDHLYSALDQQGINTYKDDETLPRGESIGPSLVKAIEESMIAMIVFSKNYADSSWCLDELVKIMECRDERGQIVMPIFYDVDPSDIRKQKRKFGEAFAKQDPKNSSRVGSWRKALVDAANISGWEPKLIANGHESKCIREIVEVVSHRLHPINSSINEDLIGIETRMQDLKSLLKIGSDGVCMVGIWGLGGGGKTTLAFSVFKEISSKFDGCSFVDNVREESSKYGFRTLQEKVLSDVLKLKKVKVRSFEEGKCMMENRLRCRSVLLVLDDVDDLDQLKALAGSDSWFGAGSRIIVTTRDEHLLKAQRVNYEIYSVKLLEDEEAIQLFSRHAFRANRPRDGYEKLSLDVVSYARGLPLALTILGSFLCDKNRDEWMGADTGIVEKLKISYDGLKDEEKEIFLDIACFYRGWGEGHVMQKLDACGFHPVIGVKVLLQKALITISEYGTFDMHDLVQEMAFYIVWGKHPDNPEKHSRVWRKKDIQKICSMDASMVNDTIEALDTRYDFDNNCDLHIEAIENRKKLRLLRCHTYQSTKPPQFLSNELRCIDWICYPKSSQLPTNFQGLKLGCLVLNDSRLSQLWTGCKLLPCLKELDLSYSEELITTPDFKGLPLLERLTLSGCCCLREIHPSIGYHERLVSIDLSRCVGLKKFPPIVRMEKLEILNLSGCKELQEIQEIMDSLLLPCLKELDLSGSRELIRSPNFKGLPLLERLTLCHCYSLEEIHPSIGYHERLVSIGLKGCVSLKKFPPIVRMKKLEILDLSGCRELQEIQEDMDSFECNYGFLKSLKTLNLRNCSKLETLPKNFFRLRCLEQAILDRLVKRCFKSRQFEQLVWLRKLDISDSHLVDGDIPSDIGMLSNLEELYLGRNDFSRLHSSLALLPRLKFLNLSGCRRLVELPDLPSSIAVLEATDCDLLEIIADLPTNCKWLWDVSFLRCPKLHTNKQCGIGASKVLQAMFQGNAIENHSFILACDGYEIPSGFVPSVVKGNTFTLKLPVNWYNDFSGISFCAVRKAFGSKYTSIRMGYIPFCSLKHTTWWNSACDMFLLSFCYKGGVLFGLVNRKSKAKSYPIETTKAEFWEKPCLFPFEVSDISDRDSKYGLKISFESKAEKFPIGTRKRKAI